MTVKKRGRKRIGKMKSREGLSTIVITLILVVIVLVAVGLLWNTIQRLIKGQTQIAQIQSQFFSEQINIKNVYFEEPFVNMTIRKPAGEIKSSSVNLTLAGGPPPGEADIFSVVDLSGSMRECYGLTKSQCTNIRGKYTSLSTCDFLNTSKNIICTANYSGRWYGQCSNITSIQCDNIGGSYVSSICKNLNTNRKIACTNYSGIWYGQCSNITFLQCNNLTGNYTPSLCDSLPANYATACTNYSGTPNDKLTATQNANKDMINSLLSSGNNRIGLIGYKDMVISSNSTSLTNDNVLLNMVMDSWQATNGTCICCGINNASLKLNQQSTPEKSKSIIVMSDGQANINCSGEGSNNAINDSVKAACNANSSLNKLVIYSIGFMGADEATLTEIAKCGGGKYFSVLNTGELIATYHAIAQEILESYQSVTSLSYLFVIFFNGTDSVKEKIIDIPAVLETKTYNFNLQGALSGKITRIEVYPVVLIESTKKEVIGPLLDVWVAR